MSIQRGSDDAGGKVWPVILSRVAVLCDGLGLV